MKRVVLAYSGGLDTSIILHWLKHDRGLEVIAYTADLGQGDDLEEVKRKALKTGAVDAVFEDLRESFVRDLVFPALRAGAIYEGEYLLGTSLARPAIARGLVRTAERFGADAISHGATGKGNDQVRFELTAFALKPDIRVVAPWREWSFRGRADLVAYAQQHGIPVPVSKERPYSTDGNLLHISYEGGVLEDPWAAPPEGMFQMTTDPERAPDRPERVTVAFEGGTPVAVDGEALGPAALLARLNEVGGRHGVGRVDIVENRFVGMKSRGVYECPGGTILHSARRAIASITLDREVQHLLDDLAPRYARLVYNGFWESPERRALQAMVDGALERASGEVRLKLYKGRALVEGRRSESSSLYDTATVTFEADDVYRQADATGFIRLNALRLRTLARRRGAAGGAG